jgi:O-antigen ligase
MHKWSFRVLLVFAASIPLEDSVQFGIGRISKVFGLLALAVWIVAVAASGKIRRPAPAMWLGGAFVAWSGVSYFWSIQPSGTVGKVSTLVQMFGVVYLVWDQVSSQRRLVILMRAWVLGAFAASALTFLAAATGRATEGSRFASNNAGPNNTGALLAVTVAMACYLIRADEDRRFRVLYSVFIPMAMVAVLLTASRTAAISLALGLAIVVVDRRILTVRRVVGLVAAVVVAATLALVYVPQRSVDRLSTTGTEISSGTLNGRTRYWALCLHLFYQRPVQGIGSGAFPDANFRAIGRGTVPHNAFLSILSELGAVGIFLFLAMIAMAAWGLVDQPQARRRTWVAMGATWFVGANSLTWEVRKITWFLLAIALVQARVTHQERRKARSVAASAAAATAAQLSSDAPADAPVTPTDVVAPSLT